MHVRMPGEVTHTALTNHLRGGTGSLDNMKCSLTVKFAEHAQYAV